MRDDSDVTATPDDVTASSAHPSTPAHDAGASLNDEASAAHRAPPAPSAASTAPIDTTTDPAAPEAPDTTGAPEPPPRATFRRIFATWWPLAASWLLMGIEIPGLSVAIARLPDPMITLAAFGGIVFPIALLVESPIIMMLAASTAMCRDQVAYERLRAFMTRLALILTTVHAAIAFTPLFDLIVVHVIDAQPELHEPARLGLQLLTFWTWAIGDRRFHQGVLIRFGRQRLIGIGTALRLVGTAIPIVIGLSVGTIPGMVVIGVAMTVGVFTEAIYVRFCVRSVIDGPLAAAPRVTPDADLRTGAILAFYVPLAMTPLLALATQPIGAAGMARMPLELASMAAWPMINGFGFMIRSVGVAYNEVVVQHAGDVDGPRRLRQFGLVLAAVTTAIHATIAFTPLGPWMFQQVGNLDPEVASIATRAFGWAVPLPFGVWLLSLWTGLLVNARRTRGVTEATFVFVTVTGIGLWLGIRDGTVPGAVVACMALSVAGYCQLAWLWFRWRQVCREQRAAATA